MFFVIKWWAHLALQIEIGIRIIGISLRYAYRDVIVVFRISREARRRVRTSGTILPNYGKQCRAEE